VNPDEETKMEDETRYPDDSQVQAALRRCWQPVARVADLAAGPTRAVLLGEPLAVFLTEFGEPAVLADRCPHRGASLAMGAVSGASIRCPYHGWEWEGGGGHCTRIPSLADQRQIPPAAIAAAYRARERWGLVWTVLEEPLGELPNVPWFDPRRWTWGHGTPFELPVSLGVMIENFRDVAHFSFVHKTTLGAVPETVEPLEVERRGIELMMCRKMRAGPGAEDIWGSLRELRYHAIAPNFTSALMVTTAGDRGLLHAARAVSQTESVHYWIEGFDEDYDEYTLAEAIEFEERVYAEDLPIVAAIEPRCLSLDPAGDLSTVADRFTLAYRQAFAEFVRRALCEDEPQSRSIAS
jgi:phenylpropionate dioxygenase-like ring-hydroxylating dioxygenase large terminal subunit